MRLIEHQRLATRKARELAERRLAEAEARLAGLGPFVRRRRGDELRADVASQNTAIRLANRELSELDSEATMLRRVARPEPERPGTLAPQPVAARSPEPNGAFGLDFGL